MNEISELLKFVIGRFQANDLVNTVTMQSDYDLDTQKTNIYTLVNINFKEAESLIDVVIGYFEITILQQRNVEAANTDSKLMFNTNMIDNLNETFSVGNKFVKYLELQNNKENVEIVSLSRFTTIKNRPANCTDGYKFSISLSIPNKTGSC